MMKKIILIGIMLMISTMVFAGYDPETSMYTDYPIYKGWNIIPTTIFGNTPPNSNSTTEYLDPCGITYVYQYNPILKEYYGGKFNSNDSSTIIGTPFNPTNDPYNKIYSTNPTLGGMWAYATKQCLIPVSFGTTITWNESTKKYIQDTFKLVEGWNFILINPAMIGLSGAEVFKNCNLISANGWYASDQKWATQMPYDWAPKSGSEFVQKIMSNTTKFDKYSVGGILIIKTSSECKLNYGINTATSPPALPN